MNWRDITVGALVTLVVSTAAGILVWSITRETEKHKNEQLIYAVDQITTLTTGQGQFGVVTIKFANVGTKSARDVRGVASFPDDVEIIERQLSSSYEPVTSISDASSGKNILSLETPSLAPGEIITAAVLVRGGELKEPTVGLRSLDSVASRGNLAPETKEQTKAPIALIMAVAAGAAATAQLIGRLLMRPGSLIRQLSSLFGSRNDTAFLLIQRKFLEQARALLTICMREKGASVFEISNFALLEGLDGKYEEANNYFQIAEWWADSRHAQAVIAFNRATLLFAELKDDAGIEQLAKAISYSRREITRYCELNAYVQEAVQRNEEVQRIISENGVTRKGAFRWLSRGQLN